MVSSKNIVAQSVLFVFGGFLIFGCSSAPHRKVSPLLIQNSARESPGEVVSAVEAVVGAMSGKDLDQRDLRQVAQQVKKDQQAQTAVEAIANSLSSRGIVKYCPVDGKRYDPHFEKCPEHGVILQKIEE